MKKLFYLMALCLLTLPSISSADAYGWEDAVVGAEGALGIYGNVDSALVTDQQAHSGDKALEITEFPLSGTPQTYIAWVKGIEAGDTVTASIWVKGAGETSKGRIWGIYSAADDINVYGGSAYGPDPFVGLGGVWEQQSHTWTMDDMEAFVLQARIYSYEGDNNNIIYVDDIDITCSNPNAEIIFPGSGDVPDVTVPDVTDMSKTAAEQAIIDAGLVPAIEDIYSNTVPLGGYIGQDPIAGTYVFADSTVSVYYSLGEADEFNSLQYGWEDGENPYLNVSGLEAVFATDDFTEGSQSVLMTKTESGTGVLDVAQITGLNVGDQVTAAVKLQYHGTSDIGIRLWGDGDGPETNESYKSTSWGTQSFTWTASADSINMQLRCYGEIDEFAYADDIRITAPGYATIAFPGTGIEIEPNIPDGGFLTWTDPDAVYGWEDAGLNVGQDGDVKCANDNTEFYTGTKSLKVIRGETGGYQAYLARITGLVDGDVVRARMMAKKGDSTGDGIRLWGHYETDGELNGSAGGYSTYCGQEWTTLGYEWTFDDGDDNDRNSLVVDARVYGTDGFGWVDDLELWVPANAEITFPTEPNEPICYLDYDLTDDCAVNMDDFAVIADSWMDNGFGIPDPNADNRFYKFYRYGWDDGKLALDTYPGADYNEPNAIPVVENITDPENSSNKLLKVTSGTSYNAKIYLAQIDKLQDGDQVYVAVKWKDDVADEAPSLQLGIDHQTDSGYAGGTFSRPVYSDVDWDYGTGLFTFDIGDPARDGLRVIAYAVNEGTADLVCGYIDEVIVSVPYHEDEFGNDESGKVLFQASPVVYGTVVTSPETLPEVCLGNPDADINRSSDSYCVVNVADLADIVSEWLDCDWSDASLCE